MNIEYKKPIIKFNGNQKILIEMIIENLKQEFETYFKYFNDNTLFEFNERALLGFVNNAIIRNDSSNKYYTIQEYCLKDKKTKRTIRADFLIYDNENKEYYLIEAKQNYTTEKSDKKYESSNEKRTKYYLKKVLKQANKYYKSDNVLVNKDNVYTCVLAFDSVKLNSIIEEYVHKPYESDIENYFYTCYYMDNIDRVLNLYGIIEKK